MSLSHVETQVASHDVAEICHDRGSCLSRLRHTNCKRTAGSAVAHVGFLTKAAGGRGSLLLMR